MRLADEGAKISINFANNGLYHEGDIADEVLMMKDGTLIYNGTWDEQRGDLESFYLAQFEEGGHE